MKLHTAGEDYLEAVLILQKKLGMVRSVDVALNEGDTLLGGRCAQLVVQALAGQRDVPFKAALHTGKIGRAHV